MKREMPPYAPNSQPEPQSETKKPLPWTHILTSGAIGVAIGAIIMIGASAIIGAPAKSTAEPEASETLVADNPSDTIGAGNSQAVNYLAKKGILIRSEELEKVKSAACDDLGNGLPSDLARRTLKGMAGIDALNDLESSELLAATVIFTCPENIGKLALNPERE